MGRSLIKPEPSIEEMAAIAAALAVLDAEAVAAASQERQEEGERWRFSGRWWSRPTVLRRERPH